MTKTQVQLPDDMYRAAKLLAERMEWSLAEVIRRALEDLFARFPEQTTKGEAWELPAASPLGGDSFFADPDWRYRINSTAPAVREASAEYGAKRPARPKSKARNRK